METSRKTKSRKTKNRQAERDETTFARPQIIAGGLFYFANCLIGAMADKEWPALLLAGIRNADRPSANILICYPPSRKSGSALMPVRQQFYALLVALIWGVSFLAVKQGVSEVPPLMLSALRFFFTAIPAVFFIPPPKAKPSIVIAYGLVLGLGQFGLVFSALAMGISVGLTGIVVQTQVFFTIILTVIVFREKPFAHQIAGTIIAFAGVVLIGWVNVGDVVFVPLLMVLSGAFCWGIANVIGKAAGRIDMLSFVVWSSLASPLPLFAASLWLEGTAGVEALLPPSWTIVVVVIILAYPATVFCFGMWSHLLSRYPAASVAPFALMVPLVGLISGAVFLGERIGVIELIGGSLVMAGLACVLFWPRLARAFNS